jgi:hypothetical protein
LPARVGERITYECARCFDVTAAAELPGEYVDIHEAIRAETNLCGTVVRLTKQDGQFSAFNRARVLHQSFQIFGGGSALLHRLARDRQPGERQLTISFQILERRAQQLDASQWDRPKKPSIHQLGINTTTNHVTGDSVRARRRIRKTKRPRVGDDRCVNAFSYAGGPVRVITRHLQ